MAGGDTLASIGEKVTNVFVNAFASSNPSNSLVFLPFAVPAPDNIVQGGIVNPTRMTAFLVPNFDAPYLMSTSQYTVHGKDVDYGPASQIYSLAVTLAQPTAPVGSAAWKRVNSEIAMAQAVLNPTGVSVAMACVPDDWVSLDNTAYWSTFDSTQSQGGATPPAAAPAPSVAARIPSAATATPASASSGATPQTLRAISPMLWSIKPAAARPSSRRLSTIFTPSARRWRCGACDRARTMAAPMATTTSTRPLAVEASVREPAYRSELPSNRSRAPACRRSGDRYPSIVRPGQGRGRRRRRLHHPRLLLLRRRRRPAWPCISNTCRSRSATWPRGYPSGTASFWLTSTGACRAWPRAACCRRRIRRFRTDTARSPSDCRSR